MKKFFATFLFSALFAGMAVAQDAPTVITQPAAGETINLYRTTTGFESIYYYGVPHQSTGDWHRRLGLKVNALRETRSVSNFRKRSMPRKTSLRATTSMVTSIAFIRQLKMVSKRICLTKARPIRY